jgi:hypothetical protein
VFEIDVISNLFNNKFYQAGTIQKAARIMLLQTKHLWAPGLDLGRGVVVGGCDTLFIIF